MSKMLKQFQAARQVSVPILIVRTADQAATVEAIRKVSEDHPLIQWDAARGLTPVGDPTKGLGAAALAKAKLGGEESADFVRAMIAIGSQDGQGRDVIPGRTIIFVHNAHRQLFTAEPISTAAHVQAVANLRDRLKLNFRMLVLLAPELTAPPELAHDVIVIDHELPGEEELSTIVVELYASAKLAKPTPETVTKGVEATSGLSQFEAEQVTAMSLTKDGLDIGSLWERKYVTIEQTPGMSVYRGTERFADLVGLDNIKAHLKRRLTARTPIGCVLFIDEIDKVLANVEQDTSGVRMDQLRTLLTEMENNEWSGLIAVGVAGGGKSAIGKAFGNEAGVPTIMLDLGGMESKYVGESEARLRQSMAVAKAIGRGHAYVIATSNNASVMRPELQRRFTDGMWMFDLMSAAERKAGWALHMTRYELKAQPLPDDDAWTGAEIRNCCRYAWDTRCSLVEAAQFIVPMARSRADAIEDLRKYANGRFLDANKPGTYQYRPEQMARQVRAIELPAGIAKES